MKYKHATTGSIVDAFKHDDAEKPPDRGIVVPPLKPGYIVVVGLDPKVPGYGCHSVYKLSKFLADGWDPIVGSKSKL